MLSYVEESAKAGRPAGFQPDRIDVTDLLRDDAA
jgi:hypothetical protein